MRRFKMKLCFAGEEQVGKTSLIRRFVYNTFSESYKATIGTRVAKKETVVDHPVTGEKTAVDFTVWDIMGAPGFRELLKDAYFYGSDAILGVCDVTRPFTLGKLEDWFDSIYRVTGPVPMCILANKHDIADADSIATEQLDAYSRGRYPHAFTSARTGENVDEAFRVLARIILAQHMSEVAISFEEHPELIRAPFAA